jgi:hypothetical protein
MAALLRKLLGKKDRHEEECNDLIEVLRLEPPQDRIDFLNAPELKSMCYVKRQGNNLKKSFYTCN